MPHQLLPLRPIWSLMKALHLAALDLLCSQKPTYSSTAEDSRAVIPSVTSRWAPLMLMIWLDTVQVSAAEQPMPRSSRRGARPARRGDRS